MGNNKENKVLILEKQRATCYEVKLTDEIEDFGDYTDLIRFFVSLSSNDLVMLDLNTPGGRCDVGFGIIDAINRCKASVHAIVSAPTSSMGALIALSCDKLKMCKDTYLMFHDYSGGAYGKGEEVAGHIINYREIFKSRFTDICKPFLTQRECNAIFGGRDIYINDDDDLLEARIRRHFK